LTETNTDTQRGQGYLISGLIKGLGVGVVESESIFKLFEDTEKKDNTYKTAILYIFYGLQENLGKLFEPFFLNFFEYLLPFFAES
jgi:hypothetical protein